MLTTDALPSQRLGANAARVRPDVILNLLSASEMPLSTRFLLPFCPIILSSYI
jgi:hypothetical protein